jgi:hypothetical protein
MLQVFQAEEYREFTTMSATGTAPTSDHEAEIRKLDELLRRASESAAQTEGEQSNELGNRSSIGGSQ